MAATTKPSWDEYHPRSGPYVVLSKSTHSSTAELYTTTSNDSAAYRDVFRNKAPEYARALPTDEDHVRTGTKFDHVEEKGPWRTSTLLSLDGGGVRGLSSLLILQGLMRIVARMEEKEVFPPATSSADSPMIEADRIDEELKKFDVLSKESSRFLPCHYFDYIAGTSTGGLIAVMVGRLRMSVDSALREYRDITSQVYQLRRRTRMRIICDLVVPPRKRERKIDLTIKDHLEHGKSDHGKAFKSDEIRCKTIVCSLQRSSSRGAMVPYLFRSYDSDEKTKQDGNDTYALPAETYPISQIVLATSCSPYYFRPKKIGDHQYCDAGFSLTNPTYEVFQELNLKQHSPSASKLHRPVNLVLSVGCGYDPADANRHIFEHYDKLNITIQQLNRALSTVSEDVHSLMAEYAKTHEGYSYFRFNAKSKLLIPGKDHSLKQEVHLLQERIEEATRKYLATPKVVQSLEECATKLIKIRRLRCATNRWETFAFGSRYRCEHANSCDRKKPGAPLFSSRDELIDHLRNVHKMPPADAVHGPEIKTLLDRGRTNSD